MNISCLPLSFMKDILNGKISIKKWAHIGKETGLNGIDLSILFLKNHSPMYLNQIRKDLENENMPLVMVTTYPDFTHPNKIQREREFEYLRHDIALVSNIGAKYLRVLAGQAYPETKIEQGINWVVYYLKKIASIGEKYKIKLVYENHSKPGVWDYPDFSHPTEIFLRIADAIKDTGIGINFDTANTLAYGDEPIPVLKKIIDRIETVHAADTSTRGKLNHVLLGTGLVPFREIFNLLKNNGFNGWICIEEDSNTGISGIKKSIDFINRIWEEV